MKINDALKIFEEYAPKRLSDKFVEKLNAYDNSGVIIDTEKDITGILFALDLTMGAVDTAIKNNCNLIFTHHPAIYAPIKSLSVNSPIHKALSNNIGVISYHLNLDVAKFGIDYYLAKGLGAKDAKVLTDVEGGLGYGRTFDLGGIKFSEVINRYKREFNSTKVIAYGNLEDNINKVATFCGAGLDSESIDLASDCDLIVSSDGKHHDIVNALENGKKLLIVTHYSSEFYGFKQVYNNLSNSFKVKTVLYEDDKYL